MCEETAPVRDKIGGTAAGTVVCWDAIIPTRMHLLSAMFLLVMLAVMSCEVRAHKHLHAMIVSFKVLKAVLNLHA